MGQNINIGNSGFRAILEKKYVDKTGLIAVINDSIGSAEKLTCVSRPRRFGKSYAAKMLCAYYDRTCDSRGLFEGLEISRSPEFEKHLNKYDVLYLDITWFIENVKWQKEPKTVLQFLHEEVVGEMHALYPELEKKCSIQEMMLAVAEYTGRKFIVIIDEWDALFRESKNDTELQKDYIGTLRAMFKSGVATDKMIAAAYITGILPIKKYGTQSAMTDFREYTMLRPGPMEQYVGFTEEETRQLFAESPLDFEEARRWYDGYQFGEDCHIYSPKSVMDALSFQEFGSYWTSSETYESLRFYIDMDYDGLKEELVRLLSGGSCKVRSIAFQNDMTSIASKDDVLTLLIHLGYLAYDSRRKQAWIPNEEVREVFVSAVENGKRKELAKLIRNSDQLIEDTISMNEMAVAAAIEAAHDAIGVAPLYYNNEQSLRSVIRMAYISSIDEYQIIQELPGEKGRADMVFLPKKWSAKPALVVELKWNATADSAIEQIRQRNYPAVLEGLEEEILLVGISYDEKTKKHSCRIELCV